MTWNIVRAPIEGPKAAATVRAYIDDIVSRSYGRQATDEEIDASLTGEPDSRLAPPHGADTPRSRGTTTLRMPTTGWRSGCRVSATPSGDLLRRIRRIRRIRRVRQSEYGDSAPLPAATATRPPRTESGGITDPRTAAVHVAGPSPSYGRAVAARRGGRPQRRTAHTN